MLTPYQRNRILLVVGTVICLALTIVVGRAFRLAERADDAASLLLGDSPSTALLVTTAALFLGTALATVLTRVVRREAGLVCATLGLAALSFDAGGMRQALFYALGPRVYLTLALELVLLFVGVVVAWLVLNRFAKPGFDLADPVEPEDGIDQKLIVTAAHACAVIAAVSLIARTDAKAQVFAAIAVGSFAGSMAADAIAQVRQSVWYFCGPLVAGLLGYLWSAHASPAWNIGEPGGYFAPLARPLPLDYASIGPAFSLLGLWVSRSWHRNADLVVPDETELAKG